MGDGNISFLLASFKFLPRHILRYRVKSDEGGNFAENNYCRKTGVAGNNFMV